jgi:hypothetical protein
LITLSPKRWFREKPSWNLTIDPKVARQSNTFGKNWQIVLIFKAGGIFTVGSLMAVAVELFLKRGIFISIGGLIWKGCLTDLP